MDAPQYPNLPPSTAEDVKEYVQLQQDALLRVLQPLQDRLGNALTWQTSALGQIQKCLQRTAKSRLKNQQAALESIGDELRGVLADRVAEQQVQLNHSILRMPSPVKEETGYFPGTALAGQGTDIQPHDTNGLPLKPVHPPLATKPLPPAQQVPCPRCGFDLFVFVCPAPVINLACPECKCDCSASVDVTYISTVVVEVINRIVQSLSLTINLPPSQIQVQVQNVINQLPPPPPVQTPDKEQLGRDCGHALHVALCGGITDLVPLGSDCNHPLFIVQCVPAPKPEFCPAPQQPL